MFVIDTKKIEHYFVTKVAVCQDNYNAKDLFLQILIKDSHNYSSS